MGNSYWPGQEIISLWANITLYAQWVDDSFTDSRDGNTYNTTVIGHHIWMAENLRYEGNTTLGSTTSNSSKLRFYPNGNSNNVSLYGYLYNKKAAIDGTICPNGWHLPNNTEWAQLTDYLSSHSEYLCDDTPANIAKSLASTIGWNSSTNICAIGNTPEYNNTTGFNALPAGVYLADNSSGFGTIVYFWSATSGVPSGDFFFRFSYDEATFKKMSEVNNIARSVRCVKD